MLMMSQCMSLFFGSTLVLCFNYLSFLLVVFYTDGVTKVFVFSSRPYSCNATKGVFKVGMTSF